MPKKLKKKSSLNRTMPAAAAVPSKELNPFYIEPTTDGIASQRQTWEGDYHENDEYYDDDDEFEQQREQEGLLLHRASEDRLWETKNAGQQPLQQSQHRGVRTTTTKTRTLVCSAVAVIIVTLTFWVLLSSSSSDSKHEPAPPKQTLDVVVDSDNADPAIFTPPPISRATDPSADVTATSGDGDDEQNEDVSVSSSIEHETTATTSAGIQDDSDSVDESPETTTNNTPDMAHDDQSEETGSATSTDDDEVAAGDNDDDEKSMKDALPRIVILGERHSGVEWLQATLQECYPDALVTAGLTRPAFWFQDAATSDSSTVATSNINNINGGGVVVVVGIFRDPYDWVQKMRLQPLYAPAHYGSTQPLSMRSFLQKEWCPTTLTATATTTTTCQLGFAPDRVVPCLAPDSTTNISESTPVYELDPLDGLPFFNVMDLREAKIRHILDEVPVLLLQWNATDDNSGSENVIAVQYESGLTDKVLATIAARTGVMTRACSASAPAESSYYAMDPTPPPDDSQYLKWMLKNVNWEAEARIGYSPKQERHYAMKHVRN